jgi:hypothetical protein
MALTKLITDLIDGDLGGGTTWVSDPKTTNFPAVAGEGYFVDTTSSAITVTLPDSPTAGDELTIVDYAGTANTNNITITSSDNINGSSNDVKIDFERGGVSMVYVDANQGWIAYNAANETATGLIDIPSVITVDYLVVAGGGAGGGVGVGVFGGGGGGAGGLRTSYTNTSSLNGHSESTLTLDPNTNYTVSVGGGGSYSASTRGANGANSTFATITSTGGGGGGLSDNTNLTGKDGGSGGGGGYSGGTGGSAVTSPVTQGHNGATNDASGTGGGGGGAGAAANNTPTVGDAGVGLAVNILTATNATNSGVGQVSGSDVYFAGGGGGGDKASQTSTTFGTGGTGGGGNGASDYNTTVAEQGSDNTGGGGGGGSTDDLAGASGGSGVVILRYPNSFTLAKGSGIIEASGSPFTEGSDKVSVFTGGTGTISFS